VGGLFALYEAYHKYEEVHEGHPNELLESDWWWVPLVVLVAAIGMETFSFRTAIVESNKVRGGNSWTQFIRAAKAPELPVVLLEDLAALLGLVFALIGISMTLLTDNGYWDAAGTAAIGALLVCVAVILAIETKSLLLGESGSPQAVRSIRSAIEQTTGISRIIHLRTLHLGPDELLVAAKVAVDHDDTAASVAAAIDAAEAAVRAAEPTAAVIFLEPDIYREPADVAAPPEQLS
jgi:divalent metal cation (Fe/Co/Zn/Cd) transporter